MCVMMFLFMASEGVSQTTVVKTLSLKSYDDSNELISTVTYENEDAAAIDIPQLLKENQNQARITLRGLFYEDFEVTRFKFDSRDLDDFHTAENFCEDIEFKLKPYLGVGAYSTDDLTGVNVEKVVETSPADQAGIFVGDIILNFNYIPVTSFCELKLEVEASSIGQEVPVDIIRNGVEMTIYVTIGGQANNTVRYVSCDNIETRNQVENGKSEFVFSELNVFPNPTTDFVNLKFLSTSSAPIKFYVLNFKGAIVHQENVNNDAAAVKLSYAFANEANGTYLFVIEQGEQLFQKRVVYAK